MRDWKRYVMENLSLPEMKDGSEQAIIEELASQLDAGAGGRQLASSLFGLSALDPLTFVATPRFLSMVALVASVVPARRTVRVDPVRALQTE